MSIPCRKLSNIEQRIKDSEEDARDLIGAARESIPGKEFCVARWEDGSWQNPILFPV
jgi:hypothetical protein